jgi:hypothetical protein
MRELYKICKHCGIGKLHSEYQKAGGGKWLQPYCKPCDAERKRKYTEANRAVVLAKRMKYYYQNKEAILQKYKEKRASLPKKQRVFNKMPEVERLRRKSECDKRYRQNNKERIAANKKSYKESGRANEVAKQWQANQRNSVEFVTKKRLRGRIYVALKRGVKSEGTMELLGCTIDFFKQYFESLFTDGMTWEKYMAGEIVIDHIRPCVLFDLTQPEQQKLCFHYTNLQPLWEIDNLRKGTSLNYKNQLHAGNY